MHSEKAASRFESLYPELKQLLMRQIGNRMRGLSMHHEDLVSTTLVNTYEFLSNNLEELPESEDKYRELVTRIARRILNRRIADFFRQFGRVIAVDPSDPSLEIAVESENNDIQELLAALPGAVAKLSEEDQLLLQMSVFKQMPRMNSATRQRLARLRRKLVADLEGKFGTKIGVLLGDIQSGNSAT